ncbi:hypothetical protein BKA82DRAFT_154526, partial [Pisolithus tinctorius]
ALRVLNSRTQQRINAPPIPGTLLIVPSIGDQLARWTSELPLRPYILILSHMFP